MKTSYSGDQSFSTSVRNLHACVLMGKTILTVLKIMKNFQETTYEYQLSSFNKAVDHLIGSSMKNNVSYNIVPHERLCIPLYNILFIYSEPLGVFHQILKL